MSWNPAPLNVHENFVRFGDYNFLVKAEEGYPTDQPPKFTIVIGLPQRLSYEHGQVVIADRVSMPVAREKLRKLLQEGRNVLDVLTNLESEFGSEE